MRRPARGATTHPTLTRPGMGYGRPLRPTQIQTDRTEFVAQLEAFLIGEHESREPADRSSVTSLDSRA